MAQYTHDKNTAIWSHPDLLTIREILDRDEPYTYDCPNEDGCSGEYKLRLDTEMDVEDMVYEMKRGKNNGTLRCQSCDEPLYGIVGNGDYDDDFGNTPWRAGW